MKKKLKNKDGAALMIAIVIMAIMMVLSLILLAVAFSLRATSNKQMEADQNRELAKTLSLQLEREITINSQVPYMEEDAISKYPLWFYLRYNVWQDDWSYYDSTLPRHTKDYAFRYFKIDSNGGTGTQSQLDSEQEHLDKISVLLYWNIDVEGGVSKDNKDGTKITISVSCGEGNTKSTIVSQYSLVIDEPPKEIEDPLLQEEEKDEYMQLPIPDYGGSQVIKQEEAWGWVFENERE